ncbi:MAG TPA: hypothetical protein VK831_01835 [Candidatus Deferrimicrobiaceae bacterium]|nr:hypothetical protein [Candidatus Deferrimicrobiaceae bacterium]
MRIYEGSPRQDWEEVLRSVGAYLDDQGMREILFVEDDGGFILQGIKVEGATSAWGDSVGTARRATIQIGDEDVATFMDEAVARRGQPPRETPQHYEVELRVIGRFIDERRPHDLFFFEQDGAYVLRLSIVGQASTKYQLFEFTREDIAGLVAKAPGLRRSTAAPAPE